MDKEQLKTQVLDTLYKKAQDRTSENAKGYKFDNPLKGNKDAESRQDQN